MLVFVLMMLLAYYTLQNTCINNTIYIINNSLVANRHTVNFQQSFSHYCYGQFFEVFAVILANF